MTPHIICIWFQFMKICKERKPVCVLNNCELKSDINIYIDKYRTEEIISDHGISFVATFACLYIKFYHVYQFLSTLYFFPLILQSLFATYLVPENATEKLLTRPYSEIIAQLWVFSLRYIFTSYREVYFDSNTLTIFMPDMIHFCFIVMCLWLFFNAGFNSCMEMVWFCG